MQLRIFPALLCAAFVCAAVPRFAPAQTPAVPAPLPLPSQAPLPPTLAPLTLETIMRGPEFWGTPPQSVIWSLDSSRVYFRWKEPNAPLRAPLSWYVVVRADKNAAPRKLTSDEAKEVPPVFGGDLTRDGKRLVFAENNDLYLMESGVPGRYRLTQTPADTKSAPRWTRDEKRIAYRQGDNLFVLPIPSLAPSVDLPLIKQITNIAPASQQTGDAKKNASEKTGKTEAEITTERQRELFGILRDRAAQNTETIAERNKAENERAKSGPKPWTPALNQSVSDVSLSPDEAQVLVELRERSSGPPAPTSLLPDWINEGAKVTAQNGRAMVGQEPPRSTRYVLLDAATGNALPITPPETLKNRPLRFTDAQWATGNALMVSARTNDNHDFFLFLVDRTTGKTTLAHDAHDDAWIGGPGAFSWGWMPGDASVWIVSEKSGWAHLATVLASGNGTETPLTSGPFEVFAPLLNRAKTDWYFTSSENNTGERHFWTMPAQGDKRKQQTQQAGIEAATLSPDEKSLAVVASYVNRPPELFLQENKPDATPRRVTVSPSPLFSTYGWRDAPTVTFSARDGKAVSARLFSPASRKPGEKGPAVVFVHGAGYLQNAHRGWSQYEHEYLFHNFLADRGYTVLDVDYRGSSGYGRDVRTAIYKHMGGPDLTDAEDGAKWLIQTQNVDARRIGIYGGSYGGFLTLMALFTQPDTWACGAALRPVSDWSQYNDGYTANILGLPQTDFAPYRLSSPIYYAQNLKGGLLICHGMEDSNVFFADTVRLTQRLIELQKTNWEVAMYPVENHTFSEAASWTDEFRRIFDLFEKYIGSRSYSAPGAGSPPAFSTP